jgi:hypothetical protein
MSKKRRKTSSKAAQEKAKALDEFKEGEQPKDEEKPFDFGGLPNRDLKKNLGCG